MPQTHGVGRDHSCDSRVDIRGGFAGLETAFVHYALEHFGEALWGVLVFGSVGRGTMRADSDMDVLLVVEGLMPGVRARARAVEPVENAMHPHLEEAARQGVATSLSPILKTPSEMQSGFLLLLDMTQDGRVLWERDGALTAWIAAFRDRMERVGARRLPHGGTWYWDLQPGFRPGDRVVL